MTTDLIHKRARWEMIILLCMYIGYMAFVLCRTSIQASGPEMLSDSSLGLTKTLFGQIMAFGTAGMVMGKLTTGIIADKFGGRKVFLLALFLSILATLSFSFAKSYFSFASINFLLLLAASAGWPAMSKLISLWYPPSKFGKVWGIISTSSRASSMLSMLFFGFLLASLSWKNIFQIGAGIAFAALVLIFVFLKRRPSDVGLPEEKIFLNSTEDKKHSLQGVDFKQALKIFWKSQRVWLMCFSLMATTILMDFASFVPIYFKESFKVLSSDAAKVGAVFPASCLLALFAGGFIYDKVSRRGRIFLLGGMLVVNCLCIGLLWALPNLSASPELKLNVAIACLFFFGLTVAPAYYLPMSVFATEFGGPHCGLLIGLIDATGYAASMIYQYTGGLVVDRWGWSSMLGVLFVVSWVAIMVTIWFTSQDAKVLR